MLVEQEDDEAAQPLCLAGSHGQCRGCLECVAAQTLLSFTRSSSVVDDRYSFRPVSSVPRPYQPSTTVVRSSIAEYDDRGCCSRPCATASRIPPPPQALTPPPSDSDVGSQPSPLSSWSDDGADELDDMGLPPSMKRSKLLEVSFDCGV